MVHPHGLAVGHCSHVTPLHRGGQACVFPVYLACLAHTHGNSIALLQMVVEVRSAPASFQGVPLGKYLLCGEWRPEEVEVKGAGR